MESREKEVRNQLVEYGIKLVQAGLVQGTWGNLSIKLDDEYMIVTPSGLDYKRLTPSDMVKVNISTLEYEGDLKPTSEKGFHADVYKNNKSIGSVIHAHSKYSCIFAAARKPIILSDTKAIEIFGKSIKVAKYALPGTKALKKNVIEALGQGKATIMANHGMLCSGENMEKAFENCIIMEECAKNLIEEEYSRIGV